MLLIEAIQRVADGCTKGVIDDRLREQFTRKINLSYDAISKNWYWKDLERNGEIVLVPNYSTGTASVATNSRSVTISGGSLTSDMVGRYFMAQNATNWYKIIAVSGNVLTLLSPIQESTASGLTYQIWKRYYRVPSDVRLILPNDSPNQMFTTQNDVQYGNFPREMEYTPLAIHGVEEFTLSYSAGSVSVSKNSNVVTGTNTAFLDNVWPGDRLKIGNYSYWVYRVVSDTQLILGNYALEDYSDVYTIYTDYPRTATLIFTPVQNGILRFNYISRIYNLVNELYDSFRLPKEFDTIIIDHSIAEFKKDNGDQQWPALMNLMVSKLETLRKNSDLVIRPFRKFPPLINKGNGRGTTYRQYRMY